MISIWAPAIDRNDLSDIFIMAIGGCAQVKKVLIFVIVLALCAAGYYYFYAGEGGILGGGSYEEAQEDFENLRPADTVWTPEMNEKQTSSEDD
jgi:hypothetical protein